MCYNKINMDLEKSELFTVLEKKDLSGLSRLIDQIDVPRDLSSEQISILQKLLMQRVGNSPSEKAIYWLYHFVTNYPNEAIASPAYTREHIDLTKKIESRTGDFNSLYEIKGKLELMLHIVPEIINGFDKRYDEQSEEDASSESTSNENTNEYKGFSVIFI